MGPAGGSDVFDLSGLELVNIPLSLPCLCTAEPSRPDLLELAEPAMFKMGSNVSCIRQVPLNKSISIVWAVCQMFVIAEDNMPEKLYPF